jgi:hypothetical protein
MRVGQTILVKQNANNSELQRAIEAVIPAATKQAASIASRYKGKNEAETCKKIFDYLKNNINYKADGANQAVRLPSGLMRTLQGDCKSYSVFTSAILSNLGIPHKLVYASYDPKDPTPTHIYVMTNSGCIIDAVYGKFNAEKKATFKKYKNMNISYISGIKTKSKFLSKAEIERLNYLYKRSNPNMLSKEQQKEYMDLVEKYRNTPAYVPGIGNMANNSIGRSCGIGAVSTGRDWAEKLGIWKNLPSSLRAQYTVNLVNPVAIPGRETFKALLRKNAGGMANTLARVYEIARADNSTPEFKKYRDIELDYLSKGGNPDEMRVAFQEGNTKTPTGAYFNKLMKMKAGGYDPNVAQWIAAGVSVLFGKKYDPNTGKITGSNAGIGVEPASGSASLLAGAPVWAKLTAYVVGTIGSAYVVAKVTSSPGEDITVVTPPPTGNENQNTGSSTNRVLLPVLLIGGAAAAYFLLKPSKK